MPINPTVIQDELDTAEAEKRARGEPTTGSEPIPEETEFETLGRELREDLGIRDDSDTPAWWRYTRLWLRNGLQAYARTIDHPSTPFTNWLDANEESVLNRLSRYLFILPDADAEGFFLDPCHQLKFHLTHIHVKIVTTAHPRIDKPATLQQNS